MAKSSRDTSIDKLGLGFDSESNSTYNNVDTRVELRSLINGRLILTGQVTGQQYEWKMAGSVVSVDEADAPLLLAKRLGAALCCGNKDGNKILELVIA